MNLLDSTRDTVENPRRIAVIGAGYVGIPTAVMLAHFGHSVVLAERDAFRRETLAAGQCPILEDGLEPVIASTLASGCLTISGSASEAVEGADFVFLCVATPMDNDGRADLSFIDAVTNEIRTSLADHAIVVNKSTVPVGTMERVSALIGRPSIRVVSNPEFLREGTALADSLAPDRIVVGADDPKAAEAVAELFAATKAPVIVTDSTTSELIKYASNAFLATKLSFINTMSRLCDSLGADAVELVRGVGADHRIGYNFLNPGPGWGGSCLPKDTSALVAIAADAGIHLDVVRAAIEANDSQQRHIVRHIVELAGTSSPVVTVLGLAFKAHTGDRRDSPALAIAHLLQAAGASVQAYDPTVGAGDTATDLEGIVTFDSVNDAVQGAHVVAVLTEWPEFRSIDWSALKSSVANPAVYDARNVVDGDLVASLGYAFRAVGRA